MANISHPRRVNMQPSKHSCRLRRSRHCIGGARSSWHDLWYEEQQEKKKTRLKTYTQKVYRKVMEKPVTKTKMAGICMRENPFYIDTVKAFRDSDMSTRG